MQTQVDLVSINRPAIAFYPDAELYNDSTNWVGPNPAALIAMLKTVGFTRVEIIYKSYGDDVVIDPNGPIKPNHVTVHAWK